LEALAAAVMASILVDMAVFAGKYLLRQRGARTFSRWTAEAVA
jgi:hypothetical protein